MPNTNQTPEYTPRPRRVGVFGATNQALTKSITEATASVTTALTATRKSLQLAEIALDEMKVDLQHDYLTRKLEVQRDLTAQGYTPEQIETMLNFREP